MLDASISNFDMTTLISYGAARSIETARKVEGKWNTNTGKKGKNGKKKTPKKQQVRKILIMELSLDGTECAKALSSFIDSVVDGKSLSLYQDRERASQSKKNQISLIRSVDACLFD